MMRRNKTRRIIGLMLLSLFVVIMTACSSKESSSKEEGSKNTDKNITVAVTGEANSLDPQNTTDTASKNIYSVVDETLVSLDEKGNIVPLLAKSWKKSDD